MLLRLRLRLVAPCALRAARASYAPDDAPGARFVASGEVDARFARLPHTLRAALLPFQREGVRYALRRRGRALIADEPGCGKTIQVHSPTVLLTVVRQYVCDARRVASLHRIV
jgi:hypothetical protein